MKKIKITVKQDAYSEGYDGAFLRYISSNGTASAHGVWDEWYTAAAKDEDGDEIIENFYDGDGIKTAPLERNIEILPAEFVVDEKKINGSKIKRHSDWYYFTATLDELKEYYKGHIPMRILLTVFSIRKSIIWNVI